MTPTVVLFIFFIVFAVLFIGILSRPQQVNTFSGTDFQTQPLDQSAIKKREDYLTKMETRQRTISIILLVFMVLAFISPVFYAWFDTLHYKGILDKESYDARIGDNNLLMGGMLGMCGLFFFMISLLKRKMLQSYKSVILSLNQTDFETMLDVNQAMNGVDRFTMSPPFIVSQSGLYVFKLGRVLTLLWADITELTINSAPRNGYFIKMKVKGKIYFFTISDRPMLDIFVAECVKYGVPRPSQW
ncbi:hypothetical protein [Chryseobacterium jejuense]|uniref:Transmembrane protein n=1 Tax=Chryseobacterium jejuense TaxID=445960 RepID=A0A2X2VG12_CHRJE|nr:hypothetical protein [Chryseobacterium jejuense]SDJ16358.1 hypothetical protein SAMN05421542_2863 [Chryseobacterium jejuense]SQB28096.1 Uncharacterised protein [Chryseobacterium jejuense]